MSNSFEESRKKFILKSLNEIYQKVPRVKCQGHCAPFCSAIGYESIEKMNIEEKHSQFPSGFENPTDNGQTIRCGSLSSENRCTIYDERPMICRLFGATQMMMQCPVGCELMNPSEERLTPEEVMGLLLEVKLLNLKYLNPIRAKNVIDKLEKLRDGEGYDLESDVPPAIYNVPRDMWEKDMSTESEYLKTKYTLESSSGESVDMEKYFEMKKSRVVKSIYQSLRTDVHRGSINIINTDTNLQMEFQRDELINLSEIEIYQKIFNPSNSEIEESECATCKSKGFKKYTEKNTCQFCEGEF